MKEFIIKIRNTIIGTLYKFILKPFFFRKDPEDVHDHMIKFGSLLGRFKLTQFLTRLFFDYKNNILQQELGGITFINPIGLSAGFDKNAELTRILPSVGFGFAELGSITGKPCEGNPKPRLWRLPHSKSLVVYYGLKNQGCEVISKRLSSELEDKKFLLPFGMSVAMTNCQANLDIQNAINDYVHAFKIMLPLGSYVTINISCPNAQGGQPFIDPLKLELLLSSLDQIPRNKPVFIKLSPDLETQELDAIISVAKKHKVDGIICTNLTKKRTGVSRYDHEVPKQGGLSGKVVQDKGDAMLSYIYQKEGKRFILIGSGGVFSAQDAYRKIRLGASLVQVLTGMIFEGPQLISTINQELAVLLKRDGFKNIKDAIGVDNKI